MRTASGTSCRENQNFQNLFSNIFFPQKSCRLWDNAKNKEFAVAFPSLQWLRDRSSLLHYTLPIVFLIWFVSLWVIHFFYYSFI